MLKTYWIEIAVTLFMTIMLAFSFSPPRAPQPTPTAPDRLKADYQPASEATPFLEAEFRPPAAKALKAWDCQVWGDGRVVMAEQPGKLGPGQIRNLLDRLRREHALELPSRLPRPQGGGTGLKLSLHLRGGEAEMELTFDERSKQSSDARRFLRVWADLLTEVPSPNNEKPVDYL